MISVVAFAVYSFFKMIDFYVYGQSFWNYKVLLMLLFSFLSEVVINILYFVSIKNDEKNMYFVTNQKAEIIKPLKKRKK